LTSGGQVHKGLDLLLEVFARKSNISLYVCSSFKFEKDFCDLFKHELFHLDNVKPIGFIDVMSAKFIEIAEVCTYSVLPSCSEANSSSVLTTMSAGLIPIVSRECGFEDDEVHYFSDCTLETIELTLNEYAAKPPEWINSERERCLALVNSKYSEKAFTASIQDALIDLFK
jgi:glycosyltransferase involved in cell wall biosynthesis